MSLIIRQYVVTPKEVRTKANIYSNACMHVQICEAKKLAKKFSIKEL